MRLGIGIARHSLFAERIFGRSPLRFPLRRLRHILKPSIANFVALDSLSHCLSRARRLCAVVAWCAFFAAVQLHSEIIPPARRTDWTLAGIPGGKPDTSGWSVVNITTYGAVGDGTTDCTVAIQNCINAASTNTRIYFPPGTYRTSGMITIANKSLELYGDGPSLSRVVNLSTSTPNAIFRFGGDSADEIYGRSIVGGFDKGSTTISVSSATGLQVGSLVLIDMLNDTTGTYTGYPVTIAGSEGTATWASRENGARCVGQMAVITGISGNNVSFTPALNSQMYAGLSPQLCKDYSAFTAKWCGITGLYLGNLGTNGNSNTKRAILFDHCAYYWATNCEIDRAQNYGIEARWSVFGQISQNWIHEGILYVQDHNYGLLSSYQNTNLLVLDNIFGPNTRLPVSIELGSNGCVVAYNYCAQSKTNTPAPTVTISDFYGSHGAHGCMNLFEGNYGNAFHADFLIGSSSHNTVFRNRFYGASPGFTAGTSCIGLGRANTSYNIVGNVLGGGEGANYVYEALYPSAANFGAEYIRSAGYYADGMGGTNGATDAWATWIWHGNHDTVHAAVVWDPKHPRPNSAGQSFRHENSTGGTGNGVGKSAFSSV